jgi:putative ABC transport system permease protein
MGNPIVAGREFSGAQLIGNVSEVVINRRLADQLWPGEDPLHHVVRVEEPAWELQFVAEVVGVSQDMRFAALTSTPNATVFLPLRGNVFTLSLPLYFLAKGMEPLRTVEDVARLQAAISMPSLGVNSSYRVDEQLRQSFTEQKARVWSAAIGAAFVALIAYTGLYGVLVHSVNAKRKEMAIRACFGASAGDLRKIIIHQALQCCIAAVAISLLTWRPITLLASSAWLGKVELGWQPAVGVALLCLTAALGISLVPASAAAKVSPSGVLKEQ